MLMLENNYLKIELSVEGYQFPEATDFWDANWCNILCVLNYRSKVYKITDPALTTFEIRYIKDWFNCLYKEELPQYAQLNFTEPCLEFDFLRNKEHSIRIKLNLNSEFSLHRFIDKEELMDACVFVFELSKEQLKKIVERIDETIHLFPEKKES